MNEDAVECVERYASNHPDVNETDLLVEAAKAGLTREKAAEVVEAILGEPSRISTDSEPENHGDTEHESPDAEFTGEWGDVDFASTDSGVYPPELLECEQWMGRGGESGKQPFAPWGDEDAPAECSREGHTRADTCGCDARWKWGYREHYVTGEELEMFLEDPKFRREVDGRVFIQLDDDPYAFVDGDDVVCPETGAVHPAFIAILEHLGVTYTDVSTSGSGAHAYYRGELPIDKGQATFEIDTEPWGANDDLPAIEIYANKHVNVTTGKHVRGTPLEVVEWDEDVLKVILEANGYSDEPTIEHDTDRERPDLEEYEPNATHADETTDDIRDILTAVDRLRPSDLPLRTRKIGKDSTGWEKWDPNSYRSSTGNDSLHTPDGETFYDQKKGEAFGVLKLFALEQGIIKEPHHRLAGEEWWEAVDAARDAGAPIPEFDGDTDGGHDPVSALPLEQLDALSPEERRRAAKKRGIEWPTTDEARDRLRDEIVTAIRSGTDVVLDAPTSLGKSHTVATESWTNQPGTTGEQPVVHLAPTRDARDENVAKSDNAGVSRTVLLGRHEACTVAGGDHDPNPDGQDPEHVVTIAGEPASEWFDRVCDERGVPFSVAHKYLEENHDQGYAQLPCSGDVRDDGGECPAVSQWEDVPRYEDGPAEGQPRFDVIHATHQFAYVPSLIRYCNVVIDEQPDFSIGLSQDRIRRAVTAYLREIDAPVSTFEAFVSLARHDDVRGDAANERDRVDQLLDVDPSREWFLEHPDAHALAPGLARAIWFALKHKEPDANGRVSWTLQHEPPRYDVDEDRGGHTWLTVVVDEENTVRSIRNVPAFTLARSIVGLDAHPSAPLWQRNVHSGIETDAVLDADERQLWRRYERGLTVVQVGEHTRPVGSDGRYYDKRGDRALMAHLRDRYGDDFATGITGLQAATDFEENLEAVGADEPEIMTYGSEKSRDDFGEESVGLVSHCIDPGDGFVLDLLAEHGVEATPERSDAECDACGGDGCSECGGTGLKRAHGRGFEGPDADVADAILASVRENHVAQAVGRYARSPDDPENTATVFMRTDAAPPGFADLQVPGVEWVTTDRQRSIVEALRERGSATARELADVVGTAKRYVFDILERLEENGTVTRNRGAGDYNADVFHAGDGPADHVDLGGDQSVSNPVQDPNTWSLTLCDLNTGDSCATWSFTTAEVSGAVSTGGDPPPHDAD